MVKIKNTPKMSKAFHIFRANKDDLNQQAKLIALGQLTSNIAHEIRNPLSAISHACQLLEEDASIQDSSKYILGIVSKNVQRINQMIDEILNAHHHDPSKIVSIQLNKFLKDFYAYFCEMEKIPAHQFRLNVMSECVYVEFNPLHLDQILWNLCRNGWRYCRKNSASLQLSLQENSEGLLTLAVINDGEAITPKDQPRLFEPFYTTETKGTGLGLYVSRELCLQNQANLVFESSEIGTIFSIQLKRKR